MKELAEMTDHEIIKSKEVLKKKAREKAYRYEFQFHGCSQAVLLTLQEVLGLEDELTFKAASALSAGLCSGKTCGALTAGVMALGMRHGRARIKDGVEGLMPARGYTQRLVQRFEQEFVTTSCREISGVNWMDPQAVAGAMANSEGLEKCAQLCGRVAEMTVEILSEATGDTSPDMKVLSACLLK